MSTHGEKCDAALRRLREALDPLLAAIQEASIHPGRVTSVTAAPAVFSRLASAIADSEVWPLELLGPVEVPYTDKEGKPGRAPAWFTRGWHDHYRFALFARRASRRIEGGPFEFEDIPLNTAMHHTWWAPPDDAGKRATWGPVPSYEAGAVPVTVWVNPLRRAS